MMKKKKGIDLEIYCPHIQHSITFCLGGNVIHFPRPITHTLISSRDDWEFHQNYNFIHLGVFLVAAAADDEDAAPSEVTV